MGVHDQFTNTIAFSLSRRRCIFSYIYWHYQGFLCLWDKCQAVDFSYGRNRPVFYSDVEDGCFSGTRIFGF